MIQYDPNIDFSIPFKFDPNHPVWFNLCRAYVVTGEVDPMYLALSEYRQKLNPSDFNRLMFFYVLFYDIGTAIDLLIETCYVEHQSGQNLYQIVKAYVDNPNVKRGSARRHFRAKHGNSCIDHILKHFNFNPNRFFQENLNSDYSVMSNNLSKIPQFGHYFQWKMMDFYDRVFGLKILVSESDLNLLPSSPRDGAALVAAEMNMTGASFQDIVKYMTEYCQQQGMMSLPANRLVDYAEIETFLCGIKHQYNATGDWIGRDINKSRKALEERGDNKIAKDILALLPKQPPKEWSLNWNGKSLDRNPLALFNKFN